MRLKPGISIFTLSGYKINEGKKEEYIYSAILADTPLTERSDMDHTVLPANYIMCAFPS